MMNVPLSIKRAAAAQHAARQLFLTRLEQIADEPVQRGDVWLAGGEKRTSLVLVTKVVSTHALFLLCHAELDAARELDLVASPSCGPLVGHHLVVAGGLSGTVLFSQLSLRVARLDEEHTNAVQQAARTDGVSLHGFPHGPRLCGRFDWRYEFYRNVAYPIYTDICTPSRLLLLDD